MQKITPFLWFEANAEEAVRFYTSTFPDSAILETTRYCESNAVFAGKDPDSVMTIRFRIEGQEFTALNGGPAFHFSPAISFSINCETQEELDRIWDKLIAGGSAQQCGWLTDRYGLSWQIIPSVLPKLMADDDRQKRDRVVKAMLQMQKLDIATLKRACEETGEPAKID